MTSCHRFRQLALLAALLTGVGWLPLGPLAETRLPGPVVTAAAGAEALQPTKYPAQVLILRHAEKPSDRTNPHLTSRGAARAAALPSLFLIPPTFPTTPAPFPVPDFLFATKASERSNRPVETVTPLAKALGDRPIHHAHKNDAFKDLADSLFDDAKYAGKTTLICWHHGRIPALTRAVLDRAKNGDQVKVPERWDDAVFDRIWQLTFDEAGQATFTDRPQRLLFQDQAK